MIQLILIKFGRNYRGTMYFKSELGGTFNTGGTRRNVYKIDWRT